jgi:hypothetical protein
MPRVTQLSLEHDLSRGSVCLLIYSWKSNSAGVVSDHREVLKHNAASIGNGVFKAAAVTTFHSPCHTDKADIYFHFVV